MFRDAPDQNRYADTKQHAAGRADDDVHADAARHADKNEHATAANAHSDWVSSNRDADARAAIVRYGLL